MCEWFTLTPALSRRGRGGLIGVLCFSLGSRLRGNDGGSAPFTLTPALSRRGRGDLIGVLCFSLGSRLRGNDGGSAPFTLTPALSRRGRGDLIGVLCFSLGSRLRGNDGSCAKHPRWERARACPGLEPGVRVDNAATYAQCPFRRAKGARAKRAGYARGRGVRRLSC